MAALSKKSIALVAVVAICCSAYFVSFMDEEEPDSVTYLKSLYYDANGGENAPIKQASSTATGAAKEFTISSQIPTRAGYTFVKWNTNSSGTGTDYYPGGTISISGRDTVTLYAVWTLTTYTHSVVYYSNGGTGWMNNSVVTDTNSGSSYVTLASCGYSFTGYDFVGWMVNGATYQPGQSVPVGANGTVTATAQWQARVYSHTIAYDANGGSGAMANTVISTVNATQDIGLPVCTFTKAGYSFAGWLVGGAAYQPGQTVAVGANATVTAVAQWIQNTLTVGSVEKQYAIAGKQITFACSSTANPSGASVSYNASETSSGMTVSINGNTVTCASAVAGAYTFTLTASAANYNDSSTVVTVEFVPELAFANSPSAGALNA